MSRRYDDPPPEYLTAQGVAGYLGVSFQRLYKAGVYDLLDSWQVAPRAVLYRRADVAELAYWRHVRAGLIALGILASNSPGWPRSMLEARNNNSEDYHGTDCPLCGAAAVYVPAEEWRGTWCPEHGVVQPGDYKEE